MNATELCAAVVEWQTRREAALAPVADDVYASDAVRTSFGDEASELLESFDAADRTISNHEAFAARVARTLSDISEAIGTLAYGGGGLTCAEADDLVALYREAGLARDADYLADAHALSDTDDTDDHYARGAELRAKEKTT